MVLQFEEKYTYYHGQKQVEVFGIADDGDTVPENSLELDGLPEGVTASAGSIILKPSQKKTWIADSTGFKPQQ